MKIAIIPARSGSKRLPNKNIREFSGKPLIAWSIEAAIKSCIFDRVFVSTDGTEIANIAIEYGANVPFLRPSELSQTDSSSVDVVIHLLSYLKDKAFEVKKFMLLQPTSPLRTDRHIIEADLLMTKTNSDSVVSVCPVEHSLTWNGVLKDHISEHKIFHQIVKNSGVAPDESEQVRLNGAIYLMRANSFLKHKSFVLKNRSIAYQMSLESSIDIDTKYHFEIAEFVFKKNSSEF